jgi:hypothetical protein
MFRIIFISTLLLLFVCGCHKYNSIQSIKEAPEWLQNKIDTMSLYQEYEGTILYRYKWQGAYIYHFEIPNSTCLYCAMYIQSGDTLLFVNESEFQDFLHNKTDSALIWEWHEKL